MIERVIKNHRRLFQVTSSLFDEYSTDRCDFCSKKYLILIWVWNTFQKFHRPLDAKKLDTPSKILPPLYPAFKMTALRSNLTKNERYLLKFFCHLYERSYNLDINHSTVHKLKISNDWNRLIHCEIVKDYLEKALTFQRVACKQTIQSTAKKSRWAQAIKTGLKARSNYKWYTNDFCMF